MLRDITNSEVINESPTIFIGKPIRAQKLKVGVSLFSPYEYEFKVFEVLKGKIDGDKILLKGFTAPSDDEGPRDGFECGFRGGFKIGAEYLILVHAPDSRGYRRVEDHLEWVERVRFEIKNGMSHPGSSRPSRPPWQ